MEAEHYLDNSATTKVSPAAAQKALALMCANYGNPSSLHSMGLRAEEELESARHAIAKSLSCDDQEIFFTSGGTESNNLAVTGACAAQKRAGNRIVTSSIEHSSVLETMEELKKQGYDVVFLPPDTKGRISAESIANAVDSNTILVSVMYVNNEIGSIMEIDKIKKAVLSKQAPALIHTDAVQAYGKLPIKVKKLGVDLLSVSAHKIHGPKGIGALYIKKGVRILPQHFGGEQERKIRPGTEALPLIGAFGEAVRELDIPETGKKIKELNDYAKHTIGSLQDVTVISPEDALPYILNVSVKGIRSETMLHHLAQQKVYVSSGSACAKGQPSHVLKALGIEKDLADSALRISFSKYSTKEDIDALYRGIQSGIQSLVKKS